MTTPTAQATIAERHVTTPHGRVYAVEVPGEEPAIVLMHGFPDDHRIYDKLLPRLSPRRAVAFDFVGYGRSERTDGPHFSSADHGEEITSVLDGLGIDRAVLVGQDASGPDAVLYALAHGDRAAHLVLLNTVFGNQPSLIWPEMTRLFSDPQLKTLADDLVSDPNQLLWVLQRWGAQLGLDADDPEGIVRHSIMPQFYGDEHQSDAIASVRAWCATLREALDQQDELAKTGALACLKIPVLIIWGLADRYLTAALADEIAALFEKSSVHFLPFAGHYPQHDQPDQVAELLKKGRRPDGTSTHH
jgi:pimeloyl-ACP methyl ester carboxylesterase